jgi:hypothetical protein
VRVYVRILARRARWEANICLYSSRIHLYLVMLRVSACARACMPKHFF